MHGRTIPGTTDFSAAWQVILTYAPVPAITEVASYSHRGMV